MEVEQLETENYRHFGAMGLEAKPSMLQISVMSEGFESATILLSFEVKEKAQPLAQSPPSWIVVYGVWAVMGAVIVITVAYVITKRRRV